VTRSLRSNVLVVRQFQATVVEGPDRGARAISDGDELTIGVALGNTLQLTDPAVSRHHLRLRVTDRGLELRDLGSTNGTLLGESEVRLAYVKSGVQLRAGTSTLRIELLDSEIEQPLGASGACGALLGISPVMRRLYAVIEKLAASTGTVLIEGETGTGKELVAEALHQLGPRRHGPFVIVDCGALPRDLIESELFGHVRGAFTGADANRIGAFEAANGGTLFLDEIGELPLKLQPTLLRVLENRTIRPAGATDYRPVDVRVLAATRRNLHAEVNRKRFRSDLFYRLNILRVDIPPLRERDEDIELLLNHFWRMFRPDSMPPAEIVADFLAQTWPGNVRELRNAVERACFTDRSSPQALLPYGQAKERAIDAWEKRWVEGLLAANQGNVSRASRSAQMARSHLRDLIRKHRIVVGADDE
jgi:DNA-binding NtrC family response regulator